MKPMRPNQKTRAKAEFLPGKLYHLGGRSGSSRRDRVGQNCGRVMTCATRRSRTSTQRTWLSPPKQPHSRLIDCDTLTQLCEWSRLASTSF
jgi:hypothetical protein